MNTKYIASSSSMIDRKYLNNKWCHLCFDESSCGHDLVAFLKHYYDEQLIMIKLAIVILFSFFPFGFICSRIEARNRIVKTKKRCALYKK